MQERRKFQLSAKAFVVFLIALFVLLSTGRKGFSFEGPPAKDSSSASKAAGTLAQNIKQKLK